MRDGTAGVTAGVTEDPSYLKLLDVVLACYACREKTGQGSPGYEGADDALCEAKYQFETHLEHCVDTEVGRVLRAIIARNY
jgi:hypothetical protein